MLIHASCVAIDGSAILLRGPSGRGKSDLALRLIDSGADLVADDQVALEVLKNGSAPPRLLASAPAALSGLLEVRGLGIMKLECLETAPVTLVIDLDTNVDRMPIPKSCSILGVDLPLFTLNPFEASAPAKVRIALRDHLLKT